MVILGTCSSGPWCRVLLLVFSLYFPMLVFTFEISDMSFTTSGVISLSLRLCTMIEFAVGLSGIRAFALEQLL